MTLSVLFNFFSNLMLAYYAPDKSEQGIANQLGLKSPWQSKDYMAAMRKYSGVKVMQIIGEIRYCDAKSKGVGNPSLGGWRFAARTCIQNSSLTNEGQTRFRYPDAFVFLSVGILFILSLSRNPVDDSIENNILHSYFYYYLI